MLTLREDEIKTESDPTALPTFCLMCFLNDVGMGWCEPYHRTSGILSGLCFKSCQGTKSMGICNSIWLNLKKNNQELQVNEETVAVTSFVAEGTQATH